MTLKPGEMDGEGNKLTLTIRLIRSFEHRNVKHIVLPEVDPSQKVEDFMVYVKDHISCNSNIPPPIRKFAFDTMKIQHIPFKSKTNDPVINTGDDEKLMLLSGNTLSASGVVNETEISFFKMEDYQKYQANPKLVW